MTMRHKGAKPIERLWPACNEHHAVYDMIRTADRWFRAWGAQSEAPWAHLAKAHLDPRHINEIAGGRAVSRREIVSLAAVWRCPPADVIASLPDPALPIE